MTNIEIFNSVVRPEVEELDRLVRYGLTEHKEFVRLVGDISRLCGNAVRIMEDCDENRWDSSHKKRKQVQKSAVVQGTRDASVHGA